MKQVDCYFQHEKWRPERETEEGPQVISCNDKQVAPPHRKPDPCQLREILTSLTGQSAFSSQGLETSSGLNQPVTPRLWQVRKPFPLADTDFDSHIHIHKSLRVKDYLRRISNKGETRKELLQEIEENKLLKIGPFSQKKLKFYLVQF